MGGPIHGGRHIVYCSYCVFLSLQTLKTLYGIQTIDRVASVIRRIHLLPAHFPLPARRQLGILGMAAPLITAVLGWRMRICCHGNWVIVFLCLSLSSAGCRSGSFPSPNQKQTGSNGIRLVAQSARDEEDPSSLQEVPFRLGTPW